jgi:Domain of unknown function (DUF397)
VTPEHERKASASQGQSNCVLVGERKARASNPHGSCVQVGEFEALGLVTVRDSKMGALSPTLAFDPAEWEAFIDGVKNGEFDLVDGHLPAPKGA